MAENKDSEDPPVALSLPRRPRSSSRRSSGRSSSRKDENRDKPSRRSSSRRSSSGRRSSSTRSSSSLKDDNGRSSSRPSSSRLHSSERSGLKDDDMKSASRSTRSSSDRRLKEETKKLRSASSSKLGAQSVSSSHDDLLKRKLSRKESGSRSRSESRGKKGSSSNEKARRGKRASEPGVEQVDKRVSRSRKEERNATRNEQDSRSAKEARKNSRNTTRNTREELSSRVESSDTGLVASNNPSDKDAVALQAEAVDDNVADERIARLERQLQDQQNEIIDQRVQQQLDAMKHNSNNEEEDDEQPESNSRRFCFILAICFCLVCLATIGTLVVYFMTRAVTAAIDDDGPKIPEGHKYAPPSEADCLSITNGGKVNSQDTMDTMAIDLKFDIELFEEASSASWLAPFMVAIRKKFIPTLVGCNEDGSRRLLPSEDDGVAVPWTRNVKESLAIRFVIANVVASGTHASSENCQADETIEPCYRASVKFEVFLRGMEDVQRVIALVEAIAEEAKGSRRMMGVRRLALVPFLELEPDYFRRITLALTTAAADADKSSNSPTTAQTLEVSQRPSVQPSLDPSTKPTNVPFPGSTPLPTSEPAMETPLPTVSATKVPTSEPSSDPTFAPFPGPSPPPTPPPTLLPTSLPTASPTLKPSAPPTPLPTPPPTGPPTLSPTLSPTKTAITGNPTTLPSRSPSYSPSRFPTALPSQFPSKQPSKTPTDSPTFGPTSEPTMAPTPIISLIQPNFPVTSSSVEDNGPEQAIDGILDPDRSLENFFSTEWGFRHWWMVDLKAGWGSNVVVTRITITNGGCCKERLQWAVISLLSEEGVSLASRRIDKVPAGCNTDSCAPSYTFDFPEVGNVAKILVALNPIWNTRLTFSELEAWGYVGEVPTLPPSSTVALISPGYPVSAKNFNPGDPAAKAIDGDTATQYASEFGRYESYWLIVDIKGGRGSEVTVETVSIWNTASMDPDPASTCCERRIHGTRISLLASNGSVLASAVVGVFHTQEEYKFDFGSVSNVASIRLDLDATLFFGSPWKRLHVSEIQAWGTVP